MGRQHALERSAGGWTAGVGASPATFGPAMDTGYYLMLAPLSAGEHTIHFTGSMPATIAPYWTPFSVDVTYHITVLR